MMIFAGNEIDTNEAARRAGCSKYVILDAIHEGTLYATNIGYGTKRPRWAIDPDDLKDWLNRADRFNRKIEQPKGLVSETPKPIVKEEVKPKAFIKDRNLEKYEKLMAKHQAMLKRLEMLENELLELAGEIEDIINE